PATFGSGGRSKPRGENCLNHIQDKDLGSRTTFHSRLHTVTYFNDLLRFFHSFCTGFRTAQFHDRPDLSSGIALADSCLPQFASRITPCKSPIASNRRRTTAIAAADRQPAPLTCSATSRRHARSNWL